MQGNDSPFWPFPAKAAIFDFDGTLADTANIWHEVDMAFMERRSITYTKDYAQRLSALGFADGAQYTIDRYGLSETVEEVCAEWNALGKELYASSVTLRPGAQRYIEALRLAGVPCALATTNTSEVLGSMRHVRVDDLFDERVHGHDVSRGKDHPDIYLEAARRLDVRPEDCLVFEDIVPAVRSAGSVGMTTCGVRANDPSQHTRELRELSDLWLDDWLDIFAA